MMDKCEGCPIIRYAAFDYCGLFGNKTSDCHLTDTSLDALRAFIADDTLTLRAIGECQDCGESCNFADAEYGKRHDACVKWRVNRMDGG